MATYIQQSIDPPGAEDARQVEHKVLLLYLVHKLDMPVSQRQVTDFVLDENYMNTYLLQKYLKDMVEIRYLDATKDEDDQTYFTITEEGRKALDVCIGDIPQGIRSRISHFVSELRPPAQDDFFSVADYLVDLENGEYIVKCGFYENNRALMEITVNVVTMEQAVIATNNWKRNVNTLYGQMLDLLLKKAPAQKAET